MEPIQLVLKSILLACHIRDFGICAWKDCLPLLPCRAQERLPQAARSVLVCLFPFPVRKVPVRNVAHYAVPSDYHNIVGEKLDCACKQLSNQFPENTFVWFVDNSPIREVAAAQLAGLGVRGANGLLQCEQYGSDCFIGTIVTDQTLPYSQPNTGECSQCGRCIQACPSGALRAGEPFDPLRCRSHITQKKGVLSPWEEEQIRAGGLIWGCDICTDVCPINQQLRRNSQQKPFGGEENPLVTPENLDRLIKEKAYGYRGKKVLLRNLDLLKKTNKQSV